MLRGEFIRKDGLVIPNNITTYGVRQLFTWGLRGEGYDLWMGLANCDPSPTLALEDLNEPTLGVNNYGRVSLPQGALSWPNYDTLNGEQYFESKEVIFEAVGGDFDKAINRIALINSETETLGAFVVAISGPMPSELTITEATPEIERTFKYRIYGR